MKKLLAVLIMIFIFSTSINAQDNEVAKKGGPNEKEIIKYLLNVKFRTGTFYTSKITEKTKVTRIYSDSSQRVYTRKIDYYLTTQMFNSPTDGFQTLTVTIDSINYIFQEGDAIFDFNSTDMTGKAVRFKDLNYKTASIGRTFDLIYSPYGEVADIKSDEIDETLTYVKENAKDLSSIDLFIWNNGLCKEHLEYLGDLKKIIVPNYKLPIDSIWYSPFIFEINGYNIYDTLALKIKNYDAGIYTIEGVSSAFHHFDRKFFTYDVKETVPITLSRGNGSFKMILKATGEILKSEINYDSYFKMNVNEDYFLEHVETFVTFEVLKRETL